MLAKERQDRIYAMLQRDGAVTVSQLVELFCVSMETVRRDLLIMEQENRLSRVHGGAVAKQGMKPFYDLERRNMEYSAEKLSLARKAAEYISEGDVVGIDMGSTANYFAEALKERFSRLTIVTYSYDVFTRLCDYKDFSVILCGGHYLKKEKSFYGAIPLEILNLLHMTKCFIFPSAVSLEYGIGDYQEEIYTLQKQMIRSSDNIFILADSTKFEKRALLKLSEMKSTYTYITDGNLSKELYQLYLENNIRICKGE